MIVFKYLLAVALLAGCTGCSFDFTGTGTDVTTTSPAVDQVKSCRDVMYINPSWKLIRLDSVLKRRWTTSFDSSSLQTRMIHRSDSVQLTLTQRRFLPTSILTR